jgi:hypothetical protein
MLGDGGAEFVARWRGSCLEVLGGVAKDSTRQKDKGEAATPNIAYLLDF